jgi:uncharacterized protein YaiI (UPF0178 family)
LTGEIHIICQYDSNQDQAPEAYEPLTDTHSTPPRLFIDGDACPVKAEALRVAARHRLAVVIVSNGGLRPSRDPMVTHIVVPKSADAADDRIVAEVSASDIVVTADIRLAARLIDKRAHVLGPDGRAFTPDSIGMALAMRDLSQHLRETGEIRGFNPGFTARDRSRFLEELDRVVRRLLRQPQK